MATFHLNYLNYEHSEHELCGRGLTAEGGCVSDYIPGGRGLTADCGCISE